MNTDSVVECLASVHHIYVDRKTVFNYAKTGLITGPKIINHGRAGGKESVYNRSAIAEFVAAHVLWKKYRLSIFEVRQAREAFISGKSSFNCCIEECNAMVWRLIFERTNAKGVNR